MDPYQDTTEELLPTASRRYPNLNTIGKISLRVVPTLLVIALLVAILVFVLDIDYLLRRPV